MKKRNPLSVDEDVLKRLERAREDSPIIGLRLGYMDREGLRKNLATLAKLSRAHSDILPTQASGRWSTTGPNLGGFQKDFWKQYHDIIYPDSGEWWLEWDWSGIEARMFTAYAGDPEDVECFEKGWDIHTFTCAKYLFEWELPRNLHNPHTSPEDEEWRRVRAWQGDKDERRIKAKNFRYGVLQYGRDKRAVLQIPNVEKFGLTRSDLLARAERFLYARPDGVAFKQRAWAEAIEKRESRTFYGRRRYLYGDSDTRAKEGLNHKIQGSVADMMDWCLIEIWRRYGYGLVLNKHDGAIIRVPDSVHPHEILPRLKEIVEREWDFDEHRMRFPASWTAYFPDGRKESLHATA